MDVEHLHADILANLSSDPITKAHLSDTLNPQWSTNETGYLRLDSRMYVPEANDLRLCVFRYKHDHPLSGHFGQNHTLELCQVRVYSGRGSGQVWMKTDKGRGQRFGQRSAWAGVATNWIQRQGQRALIPCVGSGQVEMEMETDKGTGVVT